MNHLSLANQLPLAQRMLVSVARQLSSGMQPKTRVSQIAAVPLCAYRSKGLWPAAVSTTAVNVSPGHPEV